MVLGLALGSYDRASRLVTEYAPRRRAGRLTMFDHDLAVHENELDPGGVRKRIRKRCRVLDACRVEHENVRRQARLEPSALVASEDPRR